MRKNSNQSKSKKIEAGAHQQTAGAEGAPSSLDCTVTKDPKVITQSRIKLVKSGNICEFYHFTDPVILGMDNSEYRISNRDGTSERNDEYRSRTSIKARNRIRRLASTNFSNRSKFLTLTFADTDKFNIKDLDHTNHEFKKFIQRMRRRFGMFPYVCVIEFQDKNGRGAIHYHLLANLPYIEQELLLDLWGNGFVWINKIDHVDNIGAYIVKYMTKDNTDSRLKGRKSYFTSRGLEKPIVVYGEEADSELMKLINHGFKTVYRDEYDSERNGRIYYSEFNYLRGKGGRHDD